MLHLQQAGLPLIERNYRTPGRSGGEIDLIMRDRDCTTVFVEVKKRLNIRCGGAAASVGPIKQRRFVFAARHYLMRLCERNHVALIWMPSLSMASGGCAVRLMRIKRNEM